MKQFILGLLFTLTSTMALGVERISTADLIEGQATVKNYMKDKGHFEKNANGFSGYADAAAASPVDMTAGSPTLTCTRTTTTPLAGVGSFLITKDGANRQGNGCSASFSIDSKDKARVLQISYDYLVASGTYADADLTLWIYDVTNARLIQPAGYSVLNVGLAQKHIATFQTSSDSTSYRIGWHVASTSTSAYTVKIDDLLVSPQVFALGSSTTDWQSYTPGGSWTAGSAAYTGKWRRIGDSIEVRARVLASTTVTAAILTFNLPAGLTIDTAKLNSTGTTVQNFGTGSAADDGVNNYPLGVWYNSTTSVAPFLISTGVSYSSGAYVTNAIPITFNTSDEVNIEFKVPILGWGTNQVLSSDTDTRVVAASMQMTSSQTGVNPNNSAVKLSIDSAPYFDTHGMVTASNRLTIKVPGVYNFNGRASMQGSNVVNGAEYRVLVYKNGAEVMRGQTHFGVTATGANLTVSGMNKAVAGDYFELFLFGAGNNSASTLTVYGDSAEAAYTSLTAQRVSGPAQIAAVESVSARYYTTAAASVSNASALVVDYVTKSWDSHNAVTTGAGVWKFTAPVSGTYEVEAANALTTGTGFNGTTETFGIEIAKNGSTVTRYYIYPSSTNVVQYVHIMDKVKLLAGETASVKVYQDSGGALNLTATDLENYVNVNRVGNY